VKLRQVALPSVGFALLMRRRFVVELSIVTCDPELLYQTERGEYLRVIEENFGEHLFVKQIQAPWPEPNQINKEDGNRDCDDGNYCAEPFENALKHVLASVLESLLNYDGAVVHFGFKSLCSILDNYATLPGDSDAERMRLFVR
jgi:hypothetical protein